MNISLLRLQGKEVQVSSGVLNKVFQCLEVVEDENMLHVGETGEENFDFVIYKEDIKGYRFNKDIETLTLKSGVIVSFIPW